jgi:hypothetical protein
MIDKIQKIREEVEMVVNRRLNLLNGDYFDLNKEADGFTNEIMDIFDSLQEESVSEEFEKALAEEWQGYVDRGAATVDALEDNTQELAFAKGFYRGANWQKTKDQSIIELAEDHAMLAGMEKMKEQMMVKAVDVTIAIPYPNGYGGYTQLVDSKEALPFGDNIKFLVIKEE